MTPNDVTRRRFLRSGSGLLLGLGLAGCSGDGGSTATDTLPSTTDPTATDRPSSTPRESPTPTRTQTASQSPTAVGSPASTRSPTPTPGPPLTLADEPGEHVDVVGPEGTVARYVYAFDEERSDPDGLDPVSKAYLHVVDPETGSVITHDQTQGDDGRPHQRGIEVTWGCVGVEGVDSEHDFWHMDSGESIVHRDFAGSLETFSSDGTIVSELEWIAPDGSVVLEEVREMTFVEPPPYSGSIVQIDFETTLSATDRAVVLDFCHGLDDPGNEPYGGVRWSAHADVAMNGSAAYRFPDGAFPDDDPDVLEIRRESGIPWAIQTFTYDGNQYAVHQMDHPDNAFDTRWSAYRPYGLFGTFFDATLAAGESLTAKCGFYVARGPPLTESVYNTIHKDYTTRG
jgi:hypothetical protein